MNIDVHYLRDLWPIHYLHPTFHLRADELLQYLQDYDPFLSATIIELQFQRLSSASESSRVYHFDSFHLHASLRIILLAKTEVQPVLDSLQQLLAMQGTIRLLLGYFHCPWRCFLACPPPLGRRNHYSSCWWHPVSSWPGWCLPGWYSFRRSLFVRKYWGQWQGQTAFGHCWREQQVVESATMLVIADSRWFGWDQRKRTPPLHSSAQIDCS